MQIQFGVAQLAPEWTGSVVCVGTFDGVHLGHQRVILTAVEWAREREQPCVLVTFDRHPATVIRPDQAPEAISPLESNLEQFSRLGVPQIVVLAFDEGLRATSADDFLKTILVDKLRATAVVVGHDFAMGHDRKGTPAWLAEHIATRVVPALEMDGHRVSSSEIRRCIAEGDMERVCTLLGRPYAIHGIVAVGARVGRRLGYPTLNLSRVVPQATPPDGVYSGRCRTALGEYRAAISVGDRPSFAGVRREIEAFLLDYPGESLYGTAVALSFTKKLRNQEKFDSIEDLKSQMAQDVAQVRGVS